MFFSFDHLNFRYEPFPIGSASPIMTEDLYNEMLDNVPARDRFLDDREMGKPGVKLTLSEKESPKEYLAFVRSSPLWWELYQWIKSDDFIYGLLDVLREHSIDLGYRHVSSTKRLVKDLKSLSKGHMGAGLPHLTSRFEFSALPADGGHLKPHTDAPTKIVTMILAMTREGEWDPSFGGGTDVNRPKRKELMFNQLNTLAEFEDMEVLHTFEFKPNQAIVFVKTFNSWHSVRPMQGHNSNALRKSLTINIEATR